MVRVVRHPHGADALLTRRDGSPDGRAAAAYRTDAPVLRLPVPFSSFRIDHIRARLSLFPNACHLPHPSRTTYLHPAYPNHLRLPLATATRTAFRHTNSTLFAKRFGRKHARALPTAWARNARMHHTTPHHATPHHLPRIHPTTHALPHCTPHTLPTTTHTLPHTAHPHPTTTPHHAPTAYTHTPHAHARLSPPAPPTHRYP